MPTQSPSFTSLSTMTDVVLASMPFGPLFAPSLGLTLLEGGLLRTGVSSRIQYFTLQFAEIIGESFYSSIASEGDPFTTALAGEWIFGGALRPSSTNQAMAYVDEVLEGEPDDSFVQRLLRARDRVDGFLDRCLETILRDQPKIVGLTSVFQQHAASLSLAKRIKLARPDVTIVMGGANCEGVMGAETVRQFPFVDAVVSGEGDVIFPQLVRRLLNGEAFSDLVGVRTAASVPAEFMFGRFPNTPSISNMDDLPHPDYAGYFEQFRASRFARDWEPTISFETSRGCWWGEKAHCTFCGLNGGTMAYRSKSPARALSEVTALARRHPRADLQAVDNILDMKYFDEFLPALAKERLKVGIFYETKSSLTKPQLRTLRAAGVREIQPGIESLDDSILKLMRKGVTGLQNIQLLKWCMELDVTPQWNLLWGFPRERPDAYATMAQLVPLLTHLTPPHLSSVRLDRFSPYFTNAAGLGLQNVRPAPSYRHVYHLPEPVLANLAYYFDFDFDDDRDTDSYVQALRDRVQGWRRTASRSALFFADTGEHLIVCDLRPVARRRLTVLSGLDRVIYLNCDAVADVSQLARIASSWKDSPVAADEVDRALDRRVTDGHLIRQGSKCLALAIPLGVYSPPPRIVDAFEQMVARAGIRGSNHRTIIPAVRLHARAWRKAARRERPTCVAARIGSGATRRLRPTLFGVNAAGDLVIRHSVHQ
jgi:ribosomal peptide maturation radical SAM protein 1